MEEFLKRFDILEKKVAVLEDQVKVQQKDFITCDSDGVRNNNGSATTN